MTHYDIDYSTIKDKKIADEQAIEDIQTYCPTKQWKAILQGLELVSRDKIDIKNFDFQLRVFVGISGYPLEALYRKFCLKQFKQWFETPDEDGTIVPLDEQGFRRQM